LAHELGSRNPEFRLFPNALMPKPADAADHTLAPLDNDAAPVYLKGAIKAIS